MVGWGCGFIINVAHIRVPDFVWLLIAGRRQPLTLYDVRSILCVQGGGWGRWFIINVAHIRVPDFVWFLKARRRQHLSRAVCLGIVQSLDFIE